ncbi:nitrogen regulation protein NR(II) [Desulforhopalus sp. IMCC35007]|uniref:two-component system sensor histidine kinase NtrB n=1 Tax=Desulforhopalus sp. IMCC35007 TaxID=2569543 RepID=UPI0010AE9EC5|nr:ATP-binding protein [Desulforhopalus sp. IMCC35007]TKB09015.1 PAS domain S-box protein [Desulforhopalus sp. IMCC35007]
MLLRSLIDRARSTTEKKHHLRNQLLSMLLLRIVLYTLILLITYIFNGSQFAFIFIPANILLLLVFIIYLTSVFSAFFLLIFQGNLRTYGLGQILLDTFFVALLIFFSGSSNSTFTSVFFFPIVSGGLILPKKGGFLAASASTLLYGGLLFLETYGYYPSYLLQYINFPDFDPIVGLNHFAINGISFFLAALISTLFGMRLQKTEVALSASLKKYDRLATLYKRIFDNISTGIITIDSSGVITSANTAVQTITGIEPLSLLSQNLEDVLPCLKLSHQHQRLTTDFTKPSGIAVRLGYTFMDFINNDNDINTTDNNDKIITLKDISEIEKLEKQVRQTEKLAAIGMMSASIAHDFRNPLTAISGSAQLLASEFSRDKSDVTNYELSNIIIRESDRLIGTIADFLKFSRPEHASCQWFSLKSCLDEAIQVLKAAPTWPTSVIISMDLGDATDIWADRAQMFTVFSHLIQNGLAFCPENEEKITITAQEISTDQAQNGNDAVEITIADNGTGIEHGQEDIIFEPFFTTRADGTGLGLAIVKQTIEEHHGQITVENRIDSGAQFTLRLPLPHQ